MRWQDQDDSEERVRERLFEERRLRINQKCEIGFLSEDKRVRERQMLMQRPALQMSFTSSGTVRSSSLLHPAKWGVVGKCHQRWGDSSARGLPTPVRTFNLV